MPVPRDAVGPAPAVDQHRLDATIVPLLSGDWLFATRCRCGGRVHGTAPGFDRVRKAAACRAPCWPDVARVRYVHPLRRARAEAAAEEADAGPVVHGPHVRLRMRRWWKPGDLAVGVSRARDGAVAISAVTGAGWARLYRDPTCALDLRQAGVEAVVAGLEMLPTGNKGTVYCDDLFTVDTLRRIRDGRAGSGRRVREDLRLDHDAHWRLTNTLTTLDMTFRWEPRDSTEPLLLARRYAHRCAHADIDRAVTGDGLVGWVREPAWDDTAHVHYDCYPCRTPSGRVLSLDLPDGAHTAHAASVGRRPAARPTG